MLRMLLILALTIFAGLPARAQYYFENLTTDNGLSDNRVTCFFKDAKGFMWIGTANGLNRHDGHSLRIYRPGQSKYKLSGEFITGIAQDAKGRMWIATHSGLSVLNVKKDSLHVFSPDDDFFPDKEDGSQSTLLWDIKMDTAQRIWLALDWKV
jgi:ligand-binding sensor domain-containing protein